MSSPSHDPPTAHAVIVLLLPVHAPPYYGTRFLAAASGMDVALNGLYSERRVLAHSILEAPSATVRNFSRTHFTGLKYNMLYPATFTTGPLEWRVGVSFRDVAALVPSL